MMKYARHMRTDWTRTETHDRNITARCIKILFLIAFITKTLTVNTIRVENSE